VGDILKLKTVWSLEKRISRGVFVHVQSNENIKRYDVGNPGPDTDKNHYCGVTSVKKWSVNTLLLIIDWIYNGNECINKQ